MYIWKEKERLKLDKEYTNISNQIDKLKSEINIKSKTKNNIDVEKNNKNHIEISNNKKVEDALNNYIEHLEGQNSKEELKNKTLNKTLVQ